MLTSLRHYGVVSRDDQHRHVDAGCAGDHVSDETFVAWYINDANLKLAGLEVRKSKIDRNSTSLLFGQTIGVDARKITHEAGLAVVDVAGGADDD